VANETDLDFFLHLGDYIYETVGADFQSGLVESRHTALALPDGASKADGSSGKYANTLADYRYLYKPTAATAACRPCTSASR
jgi:alkaline phosphatase D